MAAISQFPFPIPTITPVSLLLPFSHLHLRRMLTNHQEDLAAFDESHFSPTAHTHLTANFLPPPDPSAAAAHAENEEDNLGYYPDGTKRTLTDTQISIFRHSEIQELLRTFSSSPLPFRHTTNTLQVENAITATAAASSASVRPPRKPQKRMKSARKLLLKPLPRTPSRRPRPRRDWCGRGGSRPPSGRVPCNGTSRRGVIRGRTSPRLRSRKCLAGWIGRRVGSFCGRRLRGKPCFFSLFFSVGMGGGIRSDENYIRHP